MKFTPLILPGAFVVEIQKVEDERGFFARTWCTREFAEHGLNAGLVQANISYNARLGTLRGMHYQAAPNEEAKLVRVTRGAIFDVIVDLRSESPTYMKWVGVELRAEDYRALYIPEGFAHGFLTLSDETEVNYLMTAFFVAESARGFRWDDAAIGISWPAAVNVIAKKDEIWPPFQQEGRTV